jgi:hypothetical protein
MSTDVPDVPEAIAAILREWWSPDNETAGSAAKRILAAAAPHLRADERARVLDEVQAVLPQFRDAADMYGEDAFRAVEAFADYLRDTLGAGDQ